MAADLEQQIAAFLSAVENTVRTGVREQIDTRRVVFAWYAAHGADEASDELCDRVAALLARDRDELERVRTLFTEHFEDRPGAIQTLEKAEIKALAPRSAVGRVATRVLVASVSVGVLFLISQALDTTFTKQTPEPRDPTPAADAPDSNKRTDGTQQAGQELAPARTLTVDGLVPDSIKTPDFLVLAFSFLLIWLGVRLLLASESAEAKHKTEFEQRMRASRELRRKLVVESAARGEPETLTYHVPTYVPLSRRDCDDVATVLARVYGEENSDALDVDQTIRATLADGGRFVPSYEHARASRALLVLIDIENDDHPWLGSMLRTLDVLERRGVDIIRYRFKHRPNEFFSERGSAVISFDALCRRHANTPLIIFARNLDPRDFFGDTAEWLTKLKTFSRRVWMDPDLNLPAGGRAARILELERAGLPRVPFSGPGWIAIGRYFAGGQPLRRVAWPTFPAGPEVDAALRAWALTAALVPDATWDQLEAVRRDARFPEIGRHLNQPYHLQMLLDWVEAFTGVSAVSRDGRTLELPDSKVEELLLDQRRRDRIGMGRPLEERAREMLISQLDPERPVGEWARLRWELKRASHELVLSPDRADSLLARFEGTAIEELALNVLGAELKRQRSGATLRGRSVAADALARFDELTAKSTRVEVRALLFGAKRLYLHALVVALVATPVIALCFGLLAGGVFRREIVRAHINLNLHFPSVLVYPVTAPGDQPAPP